MQFEMFLLSYGFYKNIKTKQLTAYANILHIKSTKAYQKGHYEKARLKTSRQCRVHNYIINNIVIRGLGRIK